MSELDSCWKKPTKKLLRLQEDTVVWILKRGWGTWDELCPQQQLGEWAIKACKLLHGSRRAESHYSGCSQTWQLTLIQTFCCLSVFGTLWLGEQCSKEQVFLLLLYQTGSIQEDSTEILEGKRDCNVCRTSVQEVNGWCPNLFLTHQTRSWVHKLLLKLSLRLFPRSVWIYIVYVYNILDRGSVSTAWHVTLALSHLFKRS